MHLDSPHMSAAALQIPTEMQPRALPSLKTGTLNPQPKLYPEPYIRACQVAKRLQLVRYLPGDVIIRQGEASGDPGLCFGVLGPRTQRVLGFRETRNSKPYTRSLKASRVLRF